MTQSQTALTPDMLLDGGVGEPERTWLRAGALTCAYEAGMLRYLRWGSVELLRGIYAAVRDENWNTIPGELRDVQIEQRDDGFIVTFTSAHEQGDVGYRWQGTITGESNRITFRFSGEALTSFKRNRIGFCVLHPMEVVGLPVTVEHVDGTRENGHFPDLIAPHQPFFNLRAVTHSPSPSPAGGGSGWWQVTCRVEMDGDTFEMEDQRNWTDASFKTYCTPLDLPFPVQVNAGDRVEQTITVEVTGGGDAEPYDPANLPPVLLTLDQPIEPHYFPPLIGTEWRSPLPNLDTREVNLLEKIGLGYLRVDVKPKTAGFRERLKFARRDAHRLISKLEVALLFSDNFEREFDSVKSWAKQEYLFDMWFLVLKEQSHAAPASWLQVLQGAELRGFELIYSGTDAQFTELNRNRPKLHQQGFVYSLNPQVHNFDNATLMENALAQGETVRSARAFGRDVEIAVTPVTFKPRWSPVATAPQDEEKAEQAQFDPRQWSLFGAGWTVASLYSLAKAKVNAITYFQAVGPLGIVAGEDNPNLPGVVAPLYHVLVDFCAHARWNAVRPFSSTELSLSRVVGFVLDHSGLSHFDGVARQRILLANLTRQPQTAMLTGIVGDYSARWLSQDTVLQAMRDPMEYRKTGEPMRLENGSNITLPPYAVLTLDRV